MQSLFSFFPREKIYDSADFSKKCIVHSKVSRLRSQTTNFVKYRNRVKRRLLVFVLESVSRLLSHASLDKKPKADNIA